MQCEIYEGNTFKYSIDVGRGIFGFIVPPVSIFPAGSLAPLGASRPKRLIALTDERYTVIDLQTKELRTICKI